MINKKVNNVQEALQGIENEDDYHACGFGLCGIPENSIAELVKKKLRFNVYFKQVLMILVLDCF
jgi:3-oxoacid CoA-transferase subunit A